jgi:hypothetical protein
LHRIQSFVEIFFLFGTKESLHFITLSNVETLRALFKENIQEVLAFNQSELMLATSDFLWWQGWDVKAIEVPDQCLSKFVKQIESALALNRT